MTSAVFQEITGIEPTYQPATLPAYSVRALKNRPYPGLIPDPLGCAQGLLVSDVDVETITLLNAYEGEEYTLIEVNVHTDKGVMQASTYLLKADFTGAVLNYGWQPNTPSF